MQGKKLTREEAQKIVDSMSYAEVLRMIAILEAARETQLAEKS